jgi:tetratricopeptide (TPR) repeat protein
MTRRHRQLLVLAIAVLAFVGMIALVTVGVTSRRRSRDLVFGLEQLDVLIAENRLTEAATMLPWLADRANEATEHLSVLKRGVRVLDLGGGPEALDDVARRAVKSFPGNSVIRSVAVYAAVMNGDMGRALEWSRAYLSDDDSALFAWVLLKSDMTPPERSDRSEKPALEESLFLAGLDTRARAEDFSLAWRRTGDWRYAADAAILFLRGGSVAPALDLVVGASLASRAPVLAADVFHSAGDQESALIALRNADSAEASRVLPRVADALMFTDRYGEAERIYLELIQQMPGLSDLPFLNLAWLAIVPREALAYYDAAVAGFPESWRAIEQRALHLALSNVETAYASLSEYTGPDAGGHELLLRLKLEPLMDARGYEAAVWGLVAEKNAPEDALRFAAWYFDGRGQHEALLELLQRTDSGSTWVHTYTGLSLARTGEWAEAADSFEAAYSSGASWMTALNLALAQFAVGNSREGANALDDAELLARRSGLPAESAAVFITISRVVTDRLAAYEAITTALELDPTNTGALLLRGRLESGSGYQ